MTLPITLKMLAIILIIISTILSTTKADSASPINSIINQPIIPQQRQQELVYLVQQDCGSCHGMTLKGGLGPSLLAHRMANLPKEYLINVITYGRVNTPMPPWGPLLSHNEITWLVEQLQLGQLGQKQ
jgi:cytochrome c55X